MTSWLHVTHLNGDKSLVPVDKITCISEMPYGNEKITYIYVPGNTNGYIIVKETVEEIIAILTYLAENGGRTY